MGKVSAPHRSPMAPRERGWDWSADAFDRLLRHGGWRAAQVAHAWSGVDIPDTDRRGVYDHLAAHDRQFGEQPPPYAGT